jgi:hypothetical protein
MPTTANTISCHPVDSATGERDIDATFNSDSKEVALQRDGGVGWGGRRAPTPNNDAITHHTLYIADNIVQWKWGIIQGSLKSLREREDSW